MAYVYNEKAISRVGGFDGNWAFEENQDGDGTIIGTATKAQAVVAAAGRAVYPGPGAVIRIKCTDGVVQGVVESNGAVTA